MKFKPQKTTFFSKKVMFFVIIFIYFHELFHEIHHLSINFEDIYEII